MPNPESSTPYNRSPRSLQSFPPVHDQRAAILVLGSMPGGASLAAGEYYAHPRNAFWPIMGALVGAMPELSYEKRLDTLRESQVALWDVLAVCEREGSLDSSIDVNTEVPNDLVSFLVAHEGIRCVFFNGLKAAHSFKKHVLPHLPDRVKARIGMVRLPSTSPANARLRLAEKLDRWRQALLPYLEGGIDRSGI